jgi:putative endopeptidase
MNKYFLIMTFCVAGALIPVGASAQQGAGIDLKNLNTTVKPGTDFYEFATGGWQKRNPLTPEYSDFGSFDQLAENNRKQLLELINEIIKKKQVPGSLGQKIGDLYHIVMDSVKRNRESYTPIKGDLAMIGAIKTKSELPAMIARLQRLGVSMYFGSDIESDAKDSKNNLLCIGQGGLTLGERDYYVDTDSATLAIMKAYRAHIIKMFQITGHTSIVAQQKMEAVLRIENAIAKDSYSEVQLRDPQKNYNKMSYVDFKKKYAGFNWDAYFDVLKPNASKEIRAVSPGQVEPIAAILKVIENAPLVDQKAYMEWSLINTAANTLDNKFETANFDFYGKTLSGRQQQRPRWKRAQGAVNTVLGEAMGKLYVEKYFPASSKLRMEKLVHNLQIALGERIQAQEWMSDTTKIKAIEKLNAFYVKIGYPNKWRDYSKLTIKNDSYWENMKRYSVFETNYEMSFLNKPVDRDRWDMTPQMVNAYYNPTTNEICFPAGILQPPFFDQTADDAFNYGAIGVVIGHEMTHGFDDEGRQYNEKGNMVDWWTPRDADRFKARTKVMSDFFDKIKVLPDLYANGELTLGENLADHGGLNVSFQAFKNATKDAPLTIKEGFTPEQRFFLAYAGVWAGLFRDQQIRLQTKSDHHALGKWRVDGALPQIDAWYDAFNIQPGDPMFLPKDKRVNIW